MKKIYSVCVLFLAVSLFISADLFGQKSWDGGAGNNSWSAPNNWFPDGLPGATDAVTIGNGFNVTFDITATIASLTVGGGTTGTLTLGNGGANENLTITGNLIVSAGASLLTGDDGLLTVGGNITNSNIFNTTVGSNDYVLVMNGAANQTISGTGGTTAIGFMTMINTGVAGNNMVDITSTNFSANGAFLTLTSGVLRMSGSYTFANDFFTAAGYIINANSGLWINNANVTVSGQSGSPTVQGLLRVSAGTVNIGTGSSQALIMSNGSSFTQSGGTVNIAGRFQAAAADAISFTMSGGTMNVTTQLNNSATASNFGILNPLSSFTMSAGTIIIHESNGNASGRDYENLSGTVLVTGGTVQFGSAATPAADDDFIIGSTVAGNHVFPSITIVDGPLSVPTLTIAAPAAPPATVTVRGSVTINATTTFNANGQSLIIAGNTASTGNWTNSGAFTSGTQTTTFSSAGLQTIGGANPTTFSSLVINNTGAGVTLVRNVTVNAVLTLTDGIVTTAAAPNGLLSIGGTGSISGGGSLNSHINGPIAKTGNTDFTFPTGNGTLYRPISVSSLSIPSVVTAEYTAGNPKTDIGTALGAGINHIGICEYWDLVGGAAAAVSAIVRLEFGASCNSNPYVNDPASLLVAHWNGTEWENRGNDGTATATSVRASLSSTLSPFTIGSSTSLNPLPVLFSRIKAYEKQTGIQIDWTSYQEVDLDKYDVERSADGIAFTIIGSVAAMNSTSEVNYGFYDPAPLGALNYYRIVSRDLDGKPGYSNIVKVNLDKSVKDITLYPNPARNGYIAYQSSDLPAGNYSVKVFNAAGQQLLSQQFGHTGGALNQTIQLPAGTRSGLHTLRVDHNGENLFSRSFVVQQ